jgi:hypothetical protein
LKDLAEVKSKVADAAEANLSGNGVMEENGKEE